MSKYLKIESGIVYHCIPVKPYGDAIQPSDKYGATISDSVRKNLNMPATGKVPLIFASPFITKAMAFGLQGILQEKLQNRSVEGSDAEIVLACDRKKLMSRVRDVTIYEVSDKDFVTLENAERQCVSIKPIPFTAAKIAYQAKNAEDLMKGNLQIFAYNESLAELDPNIVEKTMRERGLSTFNQFLGEMVREGKIIWENKERNISPDLVLAKQIRVEIRSSQHKNNAKITL